MEALTAVGRPPSSSLRISLVCHLCAQFRSQLPILQPFTNVAPLPAPAKRITPARAAAFQASLVHRPSRQVLKPQTQSSEYSQITP